MSLYAAQGGVSREIKKFYAEKDGVNREIKDLWAAKDGANRKIFSNGIAWTYEVREYYPADSYTYGRNSSTETICAGRDTIDNDADTKDICYIAVYTFSEPLMMRAGETLSTYFYSGNSDGTRAYGDGRLYINDKYMNGTPAMDFSESNGVPGNVGHNWGDSSYIFPSDISIQTMTARVKMGTFARIANEVVLRVRVNSSEYGSFLLNNTGSSNQ